MDCFRVLNVALMKARKGSEVFMIDVDYID